jgi:hypothetical protein
MAIDNGQLNWITGFIWNIADDVLRDVYVRGKYRDVILPMTVIRRLDAVLEPTKEAVLKLSQQLDDAGVANKHAALCQTADNAFYNVSPFKLRDLMSHPKQLKANFEAYLDGFSPNVQEILDKFKFRNQIPTLVEADILGSMIEKFTSPNINLSPNPVYDQDGNTNLQPSTFNLQSQGVQTMMTFLQPAGTVFIGLAMLIYGSVQALLHRPSANSFQVAAQAMPDAVAVLVFAFGVAAIVVGVVLLVSGIRGVRGRTREISRTYGHRNHPHRPQRDEYDYEDEYGQPAYR